MKKVWILTIIVIIALSYLVSKPKPIKKGCTEHWGMAIARERMQAQGSVYKPDIMLDSGHYTYAYSGGSLWQRWFMDLSFMFTNQVQRDLRFSRVDAMADFTVGFDESKGSNSMIGKWGMDRSIIALNQVSINMGGIQKRHGAAYCFFIAIHEIWHLIGYWHGHTKKEDVSMYPDIVFRPYNPCSITSYWNYREDHCTNAEHNYTMDSFDYVYLHEDYGKPKCYFTMERWGEVMVGF